MNLILFDWLSFTSKNDSVSDLITLLGLDDYNDHFVPCKGKNFYSHGMQFGSISIFYSDCGDDDNYTNNTTMVNLSGQGCREFETFSSHGDFMMLFRYLLSEPDNYHITRLDVAYDDHDGVIDIWKMKREADKDNYITKFAGIAPEYNCATKAISLYFGRKTSELFFRCYDKAIERHCEPGTHWIRFECQLKGDRATSFLKQYLADEEKGIGYFFFSLVNHYVRFVTPSKTESNKWRWKTARWWNKLLSDVGDISVYTPCDQEYNYDRMCNFVQHTCGNALAALIELDGVDGLVKLVNERKSKLNPKYFTVVMTERIQRERLMKVGELDE